MTQTPEYHRLMALPWLEGPMLVRLRSSEQFLKREQLQALKWQGLLHPAQ